MILDLRLWSIASGLFIRRGSLGLRVTCEEVGNLNRGPMQISVVMPFLNVAPYFEEAIESVRAQTYADWELLLCDDGSADGSADIARRYAALDPKRIRHLTHEGGGSLGASAARNLGLRHARGEVIALLDADDVWLPDKLEAQVSILRDRPDADAVYGITEHWYSWTGAPEDAARDRRTTAGIPPHTLLAPRELLVGMLNGKVTVPCTCSIIVRTEAVQRAGGFVDDFRYIYTDQVFYAKLSLVASVLFVDRCWDRYRRHAASAYSTVQRTGKGGAARLRFLTWLQAYLAGAGGEARHDPVLRATLRAALWRARYPRLDRLRARAQALVGSARAGP